MAMAMEKIRIIANACLIRYDAGEGSIIQIVDSYKMSIEDSDLVAEQIHTKRPEIQVTRSPA
ncbi:hypothetical protein [Paenibacillus sp. 32352]|uniref:hypothetical protein n=1 Tax=Paenibacillus sp. 32352 TaxID=1969111 RepID=UPI0009AD56FE|nr:hypothetical protein [Paenibacillus sp. 32352]